MIKYLIEIVEGQRPLSDVYEYFLAQYRYKLYYSNNMLLANLMRTHVRGQIDFRISIMNQECFNLGQCIMCGCETTALQMTNKSCEGLCYPKMMTSKDWRIFITK
jgi:hypothetical protein